MHGVRWLITYGDLGRSGRLYRDLYYRDNTGEFETSSRCCRGNSSIARKIGIGYFAKYKFGLYWLICGNAVSIFE